MRSGVLASVLVGILVSGAAWGAETEAEKALRLDLARIAGLEDGRDLASGWLVKQLDDDRPEIRRRATLALGRIERVEARGALERALSDRDVEVRRLAAFALGLLDPPRVDPLMARFAQEKDVGVRAQLVRSVGLGANLLQERFLVDATADKDATVRAHAFTALALLARRFDGRLLETPLDLLKRGLADEAEPVKVAAAYLLMRQKAHTGADALGVVSSCSVKGPEEVRVYCTRALGHMSAPSATALKAAMGDTSWRVRSAAAITLGELKLAGPIDELLLKVAEQLGQSGGVPAAGQTLPWLALLDAALALPAAEAKAVAGGAAAVASAVKVPGEGEGLSASHVACRAAALVDRVSGKVKAMKRCASPKFPRRFVEQLTVKIYDGLPPKKRVKIFKKLMKGATAVGRASVMAALEPIHDAPGADALLLAGLKDTDPAVVTEAARVAGAVKMADAVQPLVDAYSSMMTAKELEAVQAIFEALGEIKPQGVAPILEDHISHPNRALREAAVKALQAVKGHEGRAMAVIPAGTSGTPEPDLAQAEISPYRRATLQTTRGAIVLELKREVAAGTVRSFVKLARSGFYDDLTFHRVVPGFVAQGGDPRGDGSGGPGYMIRCELHPGTYARGTVGMALAGRDTGGSQFFIAHGPQPHLDGGYTIFAQVVEGMEVVDELTPGDRVLGVGFNR